jgi:putative GTP pyrophosphokinase
MDINKIKIAYEEQIPKYKRVESSVKHALKKLLDDKHIDYLDIESRVKTFKSFEKKIERKKYDNPLGEVTDICGLRIVNYYSSDLDEIEKLINEEFDVFEHSNKEEEMEADQFGYRSLHFIVQIKKEWTSAPDYRDLQNIKFEIQIRTILMHGWAAISHKLAYKNEKDVPKQFKRNLFRLSALIELADEQFALLKSEKDKYTETFFEHNEKGEVHFIPQKEVNSDSVRALLDYYFPERDKRDNISFLVKEILELGLDLTELSTSVKSVLPYLEEIEKDESVEANQDINWAQEGALRTVLDLTSNVYFQKHQEYTSQDYLTHVINHWREKLNVS